MQVGDIIRLNYNHLYRYRILSMVRTSSSYGDYFIKIKIKCFYNNHTYVFTHLPEELTEYFEVIK